MKKPWHRRSPELVEQIRQDLAERYPDLHLFIQDERAEVRGSFPVYSETDEVLDRYVVSIELPPAFPADLPITREVGGRIPWHPDFHVEMPDGKACVLLPDDRWRAYPEGAPFVDYLDGPLHNFFLGQSLVERGEPWPFGEWGHGAEGVREYYEELLETTDRNVVLQFLYCLSRPHYKGHRGCPCGSGARLRDCCMARVRDLRAKIKPATAKASLEKLGGVR